MFNLADIKTSRQKLFFYKMGSHFSKFTELIENIYPQALNLSKSEVESPEIILLRYHPINEEGAFSDNAKLIFDWSRSPFFESYPDNEKIIEKYKENFRQRTIPKYYSPVVEEHGTLCVRFTQKKYFFRAVPVLWETFSLFPIIATIPETGPYLGIFVETGDRSNARVDSDLHHSARAHPEIDYMLHMLTRACPQCSKE